MKTTASTVTKSSKKNKAKTEPVVANTAPVENAAPMIPAAEARKINQEIGAKSGLPYVKVTGNTFPCRRALWVMGGDYIKAENRADCHYLMPAHQAVEAQAMVDRIGAKITENMAAAAAKREAKALAESEAAK